ncbi:metallophosphoesterase, partial [Bacillus amyloliquefaciens]
RGMPVYTNRGLGTTQLPIRFLCRPEITVLTLA